MTDSHATPLPVITPDEAHKVPEDKKEIERFRFGLYLAVALPLVLIVSYFSIKFVIAVTEVIAPFIAALVIALLLDPVVDWIEHRGLHRGLAVGIVFAFFILLAVVIGVVGIPAIVAQATSLASHAPAYVATTKQAFNHFLHVHHYKIGSIKLPKTYNFDVLSHQLTTQVTGMLQQSFGGVAVVLLGSVSTIFDMIIVFIVSLYLLFDIDRMRARFFFLVPERFRERVMQIGQDVGQVFSDYLRGLLIVCAMYGFVTTLVLYALAYTPHFGHVGIGQYAILIGAAAGVLYAIPYIGSLTIGLITFLVALASGGFGFAVAAVIATLVINQTFDNVIAPRILGGGVGLNPVVVMFSLTLGGCLFGFWGLLFSVPIAGSIQVILFRLIPKLTKPTPEAFLRAHGVIASRGKSVEIFNDAPDEVKEKKAETRAKESAKLQKDLAAENAEAPK